MKITEVAVAIFLRADGSFLLASRPEGKPYAGYWEFPGGKIEAGETVQEALVRELREELDVTITHTNPWFTFVMHYTHATVRLHCWRVTRWLGELRGMEGQAFAWQSLDALTVTPTLPGCVPIFRALRLPSWYAITDATRWGEAAMLAQLEAAFAKGLRLVQVREKTWPRAQLEAFVGRVLALARICDARVLVNAEPAIAEALGTDGVHLTSQQLAKLKRRPNGAFVGASVHTRAELELAAGLGCDFAVLGPVQITASHPEQTPLGWTAFAEAVRAAPIPVYALGGLGPADLVRAREFGAHGVAMLRGWSRLAASADLQAR